MNFKKTIFALLALNVIALFCTTDPFFTKSVFCGEDEADKKWTLQQQIQGDIAYLQELKNAKEERLMELNKGRGTALYKLWKDHLDHPADPARFNEWFQHAIAYDKDREEAEVVAEKERLGKEIKKLDLKVRKLMRESTEVWDIQHPSTATEPSPSPDTESLQDEIRNLQALIDMAGESLKLAKEWEMEYPKEGWDAQVQYWESTKKQLEDQMKSAKRALSEQMKDLPQKEPSPQEGTQAPVTRKPIAAETPKTPQPKTKTALREEERKETEYWMKKGFTPIEIKVLKGGGSIKDEAGNVIQGWPPNQAKKSLSFFERLQKQFKK